MGATATLTLEHRVLERMVAALEGLVEKVKVSGFDGREDLGRVVGFFKAFIDEIHHAKEVGILLAHLVETGLPAARGPMAAMLGDHSSVRRSLGRLEVLARRPDPWNTIAVERVEQAAAELAVLARGHMSQEEALLFPLADQHLSPETAQRIEAMFDEHAARTDERARSLFDTAFELVARWAPDDSVPAPSTRKAPRAPLREPVRQSLLLE